jgi:hypothetical protein
MPKTKRELISRLRTSIKEVSADTKFTNRYLWNVIWSAIKLLVKQDADTNRKIYNQSGLWQSICVKMIPVSPILCDCLVLPMDCAVYRSEYRLPAILESANGFVYRFISTPDLSIKFTLVTPFQFDYKSKIRNNREKYVFIHDGYLWSPNSTFGMLILSGVFESDTSKITQFNCNKPVDGGDCGSILDSEAGVPDYMDRDVIRVALEELGISRQLQADNLPNLNDTQKEVAP